MTSVLYISLNGEANSQAFERLRAADIALTERHGSDQAKELLVAERYPVSIIRCDTFSQGVIDLMDFIKVRSIATRVIVSAKTGTVEDAVHSMRRGAADYLVGDCHDARLAESLLKVATSLQDFPLADDKVPGRTTDAEVVLVGRSPAICEIRSAVNLVAKSQTTVLITGESGTGKEIVARLIHLQSARASGTFIALNCASLPKDVIENELFGHEKGAFTGALIKKAGCFELANGGTLLFDEIAEMSPETQAKLLRAIETQKFRRLGGKEEVKVDVRMIAATNKNISNALRSKELREDLYYRLSVIEIFIPPLRERKEDIPILVDYFLSVFSLKYGKARQHFTEESLAMLCEYDWPGNVREIRNIVERALVICPHEQIGPPYLPEKINRRAPVQMHVSIPIGSSAEEAERILILQTLASAGNNKAKAAKILGLSRKTLHNKLQSFAQQKLGFIS